jgi:uncharacterized protein
MNMKEIDNGNEKKKFQRILKIYILVTFGFSWLIWLPLIMNHLWDTKLPVLPIQYYLASFGPLVGAIVTSAIVDGWNGVVKWGRRAFSLRFSLKWLLIAIGLPIIYGVVAVTAHMIITGSWPDWSQFGLTAKLPGFNIWLTAVIWMFTYGLGEESGWRGYLLPELFRHYSLLKASLIVAAIWILWHLPAFGFNPNYINMGFGVIGWTISLAYGSVLLSWICQGSNWSIIPVILWHAGFDLLTASDQATIIMAAVCSMLVIVHGIILSKRLSVIRNNAT